MTNKERKWKMQQQKVYVGIENPLTLFKIKNPREILLVLVIL